MTASPSTWVLGARSETGYVRTANEDRMGWTRTPFGDVFVVCDGMGGYRGGALAAEIALRTLQERLAAIPPGSERFTDFIRQAFLAANREVFEQRQADDPETREMGATGVALVTDGARIIVAHVGDSRAYLWRRGSGLRQLTHDHTRVQGMVDSGLLTPEEAAAHPDSSVLDRAIGHRAHVEADVTDWIDLEPGDTLLLCSDGLCGYVSDDEIEAILRAGKPPQPTTDLLVEAALGKGGHDNVTVQLVRFAPRGMRLFGRLSPAGGLVAGGLVVVVAAAVGWGLTDGYKHWSQSQGVQVADAPKPASAPAASAVGSAASGEARAASAAAPASAASGPTVSPATALKAIRAVPEPKPPRVEANRPPAAVPGRTHPSSPLKPPKVTKPNKSDQQQTEATPSVTPPAAVPSQAETTVRAADLPASPAQVTPTPVVPAAPGNQASTGEPK